MQAHRIAPCSGALSVAIVTRVVLFLGVEIVPVDIVLGVCVPFANKVLSSWCGSTIAIISSLSRWLRGTSHRRPTPKGKWRYRCSYCWSWFQKIQVSKIIVGRNILITGPTMGSCKLTATCIQLNIHHLHGCWKLWTYLWRQVNDTAKL